MTAGNEGKAYDDAVAALKKAPSNESLKTAVATAKAKLNASLEKYGQKPKS
jgi:hypothetical protein